MNPIQGTNAILYFDRNGFVPYVCTSDLSISINSTMLPSRTSGSGAWKKSVYQTLGYSISLSGVMVFDNSGFNSWEVFRNQINFLTLPFRISYTDMGGNIKSVQGVCSVLSSQFNATVGDVVKGQFNFDGQGILTEFDGIIPCPSAVVSIAVDTTGGAGDASVSYSYSGDVYQVKYRLNGQGDYAFALASGAIDIPGLNIGDYSIEIIPICTNGFAGTGLTQTFTITQGAVCTSVITAVTVTVGTTITATNTFTGSATQMRYRIDGGAWIMALINAVINMTGIAPGNHSIEEQPMCQFGTGFVGGTGFTRNFTVVSTPVSSPINYTFINSPTLGNTCLYQIYVNGILQVNSTVAASGSFAAPNGATIKASVTMSGVFFIPGHIRLVAKDVTTNVTIHDETVVKSGVSSVTINFTFTNNADTFLLTLSGLA